ncbi:hypothetical protein DGI_0063 [Megalodesulfovibrio gigas DSM 1382 = ATCC 19364]|uniref:Uncharacterized protein n=1 Tax=Megalodesulfovibrio gigas (strain ATCC 19364 / DSM 1382 / NCIMB 9332 / VKM B-1759) TaxID=1121448 RepID=T2G6U1_MEGG1|nr:hypothetical protein DGI_0063 [Megalodesulfovibrio gigas DSM 1382 = ATCC 19364]
MEIDGSAALLNQGSPWEVSRPVGDKHLQVFVAH